MEKIKLYYNLTKPGIIYGNILTALGGFLLASDGHIKTGLLLYTLFGTSLVIASACVFNNYIDRDIDQKMARTNKRAIVIGLIRKNNALVFGIILGLVGFSILLLFTNIVVDIIGVSAFIIYVVIYGYSKRKSYWGTLVGSFSGSAPIAAGYCAVSDNFDTTAILLFILMVAWQMAHFYSIAIYRIDDYRAAQIPVLPIKKGLINTKRQIISYIFVFIIIGVILGLAGKTSYIFSITIGFIGIIWLFKSLKLPSSNDYKKWSRELFLFSLVTVLIMSIALSLNNFLPR